MGVSKFLVLLKSGVDNSVTFRGKRAVSISANDNLRELGLKSLKRVRNGRVYIGGNANLCYADTIKWDAIVDQQTATYDILDNKDPEECSKLSVLND